MAPILEFVTTISHLGSILNWEFKECFDWSLQKKSKSEHSSGSGIKSSDQNCNCQIVVTSCNVSYDQVVLFPHFFSTVIKLEMEKSSERLISFTTGLALMPLSWSSGSNSFHRLCMCVWMAPQDIQLADVTSRTSQKRSLNTHLYV